MRAKAAQKIGNKVFYKNEPVLYFDSLKTSTMEGAATTVYAQGGRGNARLIAWEGERTVTFTMEDALISAMGFSVLTGAGLVDATEKPMIIHKTEQVQVARINRNAETDAIESVKINLSDRPYVGKTNPTKEPKYKQVKNIPSYTFDANTTYYSQEEYKAVTGINRGNFDSYKRSFNLFTMEDVDGTTTPTPVQQNDGFNGGKTYYIQEIWYDDIDGASSDDPGFNDYWIIDHEEDSYNVNDAEDFIYVMLLDDNGEVNSEPYIASEVSVVPENGKYTITVLSSDIQASDKNTNKISGTTTTSVTNNRVNDLSNFTDNSVVLVDYYVKRESGAYQIDITPDKFGGNFYLEASTLFRATNGVDMPAEFIIPNCKIQSNFTFTMASSGDPSTFTFTMDAFPDYTRWDRTKKVYAAIQVIEESDTLADFERLGTPHNTTAYDTDQRPWIETI